MTTALNTKQSDHHLNILNFDRLIKKELPLHYAVRQHNKELLEKALQAGFSVSRKDQDGQTAFDLAIQTHQPEMAAIIVKNLFGVDVKQITNRLDPHTIVNGLVSLEKNTHEWVYKIGQTSTGKMTAVTLAAAKGDMAMLELFNETAFKQADSNGLTPLHYALFTGKKDAVEFLVSRSDPAFVTPDGNTYLHFAAMSGHTELLPCLKSMNFDINVSNKNGCTPAHFLAISCDVPADIIPFVKQGASLTVSNKNGVIPLALLYAKAIQKTPALMTSSDLKLVLAQSISIGLGFYCLYLFRQFPKITLVNVNQDIQALIDFTMKCSLPIMGLLISSSARQSIITNLPTTQKLHPFIRSNVSITGQFRLNWFTTLLAHNYFPNFINAVLMLNESCTIYAVAQNSYCGLKRCVQQLNVRPFTALGAAGVHLLNFGLVLGSSVSHYLAIFSQPTESEPGEPPPIENCPVPQGLSGLSNLKLATHTGLNPRGCLNHAKIILAGSNMKFDEKQFRDQKCGYVNNLFRNMSLIMHPDKNLMNPKIAAEAFIRVTDAREAFKRAGACG